ncbi:MAG: flagellar hook-length control protein FliK [Azoarcus sp.]|nr:flagellar hook-length control protein FliK [Azoarcus sp.]
MTNPAMNASGVLNVVASKPATPAESARSGKETERAAFSNTLRDRMREPSERHAEAAREPEAPRDASAPADDAKTMNPAPDAQDVAPLPANEPVDDAPIVALPAAVPMETVVLPATAASIAALLGGIAGQVAAALADAAASDVDADASSLPAGLTPSPDKGRAGEGFAALLETTDGAILDGRKPTPDLSLVRDGSDTNTAANSTAKPSTASLIDERFADAAKATVKDASTSTVAALARNAEILVARAGVSAGQQNAAAPTISAADPNPIPILNAMQTPATADTAAPRAVAVPTPVGQPGWSEEVGNRVMWMLGRGESRAELVLTPPHLGKVEVSISMNGDQTTAQFVAASQAARDALEQALPRLREMLAQAGVALADANVGTSTPESQTQAGGERDASGGGHAGSGFGAGDDVHDDATGVTSARWHKTDNGLVDTFA